MLFFKRNILHILLLCCTSCVYAQEQDSFRATVYEVWYGEALERAERQQYGEALALVHKALAGQPGNGAYNLLCGNLYIRTRQYRRARPYIVRALSIAATRDAYLSAIEMELGEGNLQHASGYASRALMHFPDDLAFAARKLSLLDMENKFSQGDIVAARILEQHPGDTAVLRAWKTHHLQAAQYFTENGELETAQFHLEQAERTAPVAPVPATETEAVQEYVSPQDNIMDNTAIQPQHFSGEEEAGTPAPAVEHALPAGVATDTLALSKQLRDQRRYRQASRMLHAYLKQHPGDVNAMWLCAQTELWRHRFSEARVLYTAAALAAPENDYLMLDYAGALAGMGKWVQARTVLTKLEEQGRYYSAGRLIRANILYWSADYRAAVAETDSILKQEPGNAAARALQEDILQAQSSYVHVTADYSSDNQPVQTSGTSVEAGMFLHRLLSPYISFHAPVFMYGGKAAAVQRAEAGNKFVLPHAGIQVLLSGGAVKYALSGGTDWTGSMSFRQQVRRFLWEAQAEHKPYLYTITSLDTDVSFNRFALTAGWQDKDGPDGRLAAELNTFADGNFVYTLYGWLYASPLKFSIFTLRLGYSYSFSDARKNSFVSKNSLADVIAAYDKPVTGTYYLYFTPEQQHIHTALLSLQARASGTLDAGITADAGLFAQAQNPYLYLNKDNDDNFYIARDYVPQKFFPCSAGIYANWRMSRQAVLSVRCSYRQTWFFNTYYAGLGLKINFWHDRKAK